MIPIDKKIIAYIIGILLIGVFIWYLISSGIHNNRSGADDVREQLKQAADYNNSATEHLSNVESGLKRTENAITDSTRSVERIEAGNRKLKAGLSELSELTTESQFIIRSVRERSKAGNE